MMPDREHTVHDDDLWEIAVANVLGPSARYRVTYIERSLGVERTMTAKYGGRSRVGDRWLPTWVLDPWDQFGHGAGLIGEILRIEVIE